MSLNRALGELFKVIREEAASNPSFALKLEEALSVYRPSRALKQAARARVKPRPIEPAPAAPIAEPTPAPQPVPVSHPAPPEPAPDLNPVAFYTREGEDALRAELAGTVYSRDALMALMAEHNLDPAGEAEGADRDGIINQIVVQAKKRIERDSKLFDY